MNWVVDLLGIENKKYTEIKKDMISIFTPMISN